MALPLHEPQPDTAQARQYNRIRRWLSVADVALGAAFLALLLALHWTNRLRDWSFDLTGQRYALALLAYVAMLTLISQLIGLPLDFYSFRLEHRYQLSNQKLGSWLRDQVKEWLVGLVLGAVVLELIYFTIRYAPDFWWLIAWVVVMGLFVIFAQLAPVLLLPLFYKFIPLEDEALKQRLVKLSERAGTRVRGVYEWKLSEKSKKANAALTGLGATRRIILADTLLSNYTGDEIEAVLAHELGHHVHKHIFKSILVQAGITLFGFWAADRVLRYAIVEREWFGLRSLGDFAGIPLLLLVSSVLSLLLLPLLNAYSRFNERQADRYCWANIPAVDPFVTAMNKLAGQNLSERNPSRVVEVLFHSHPPVGKRITAAEAWAEKKA
ncbi:MAG: M48 family metallopeptidase [Acidobacteriota bacterium]|nr:M48 family metallopeptidase [Acidobacteriota bacterium]